MSLCTRTVEPCDSADIARNVRFRRAHARVPASAPALTQSNELVGAVPIDLRA